MDDDHVLHVWFPKGLDPGDKVTLDMPKGSEWVIDRLANKHSYQCADRSLDSYACVLFECHYNFRQKRTEVLVLWARARLPH